MNKLLFLVIAVIALSSCSNANVDNKKDNKTNQEAATTANENKAKPEYLTYETFKEKVWNFEENPQEWVYKGDVPCVIDFYADWCKPCKMIAPIMEELAAEYDGKVKIYKIDTQNEKRLAQVFQIRSIPAVLFSPVEGKPMMQVGAMTKDAYMEIINKNLLKENNNQELSNK